MTVSNSIEASIANFAHADPWSFVRAPIDTRDSAAVGQLQVEMAHARLGVMSSLFVSLRAKHGPAASHSLRVALWASAWGTALQLDEEHLQLFETLGLLHEIGKIGIPDRVLQKPDKLSNDEQSMMALHPRVGLEIVRAAGGSNELLLGIAGLGTSFNSLSHSDSNEIAHVASRLINIVDAFDSMTTQQVYRDPVPREAALAEILHQGGIQFDPRLAHSFAELVNNPNEKVFEHVRKRWVARLDSSQPLNLFNLDRADEMAISRLGERASSALVHKLNDTFYRHMMDHVQDGVIFVDSEFRVLDWNATAERLTGKSASSVYQQTWNTAFASLCDSEGFALESLQCPFLSLMQTSEKFSRRLSIRRDGHEMIHVQVEVIPVHDNGGHLCGGAMIIEDISETAVLEQKIVYLRERASQDQLTKVPNRGELNRQLPDFVDYHQRSNRPGSVIICDIDFFKRINDNFSHQVGDEALIVFAKVLKDSCRESDFVARYGGEEFVLLCSECDFSEAKEWAESIRKKLQRTPIAAIRNACITASFGVSTVLPGDTAESVLERADQGLLIAKQSGRDRVVGLGLDSSKERKVPNGKGAPAGGSWLSWFKSPVEQTQKFELGTNVPRGVALEKLKCIVNDLQATVLHVENDNVVLEIDCKKAPIPFAKNERLGKFRVSIEVVEVEMRTGPAAQHVNHCTLLNLDIQPIRSRDRRSETAISQAMRLKTVIQGFMLAYEMDDTARGNVIRRITKETDSRY